MANVLSRRRESESDQLVVISSFNTDLLQQIKDSWKEDDEVNKINSKLESATTNHSKYS